ncbi:MAG: hydantoinase/oxoprolinase family protein, partial [Actinomycetota bacterium]|nr:hydantoinase/oxoprolinase family protein [Actinomycetota bacterium]
MAVGKALTSPPHLINGLRSAIGVGAEQFGLSTDELLAACDLFVYSTTQATNAILEGKTARTALLVTEGFPDILVRREGGSMLPYDFSRPYPEPYIPRRLTLEVPERISVDGDIVKPLDEAAALQIMERLRENRIEAVAVCLLWSTTNGEHEEQLGEMIEATLGVPFTLSHQLNPIVREYRRASGAAIDASLKLLMPGHLAEIEEGLSSSGFSGELLAATSVGGALPMGDLVERPIYAAKSGPSLAPIAGSLYTEELGSRDIIVCDTGGTSFDISLVRDGAIVTTRETWLGGTFTGHLTGMSSVDVRSIGAGGGSIAWVDPGGLLRVGPESAGADPGPACYGNGGTKPTVTDAALVLGYLDPDGFLGGRMKLDAEAANTALSGLASELGLTVEHAAEAVMTVANEHMVDAIKEITINQGIDPRASGLVAGGGAAGLGIAAIASELGCSRIMLPRTAGALSAFGGQYSDIVIEQGRSAYCSTDSFDFEAVNAALDEIDLALKPFAEGLAENGVDEQRIERTVEARYAHQVWSLDIPLGTERFSGEDDVEQLVEAFHQNHERVFAVSEPGQTVELVHFVGRLTAEPAKPARGAARPDLKAEVPAAGKRKAHFRGHGEIDVEVRPGAGLEAGTRLDGPVLVTEPTTTIVVPPEWRLEVTAAGDYLLEIK